MEEQHYHDTLDHHHDNQYQIHDDMERGSGVGGARWNPTKEQIVMLERMYSEGIRTPSAEQIHQITARLRVYGDIEGKNVFYWFQNHKARQRQKQKQDHRFATSNILQHQANHLNHQFFVPPPHYHHHYPNQHNTNNLNLYPRPIFPAPPTKYHHQHHQFLPNPNVICNPYHQFPQSNLGFIPPQPSLGPFIAPSADHSIKRSSTRAINKHMEVRRGSTLSGHCGGKMDRPIGDHVHHHYEALGNYTGVRTLELFPVHPTGILEYKFGNSTNNSAENNSSSATSSSSDSQMNEDGQRFFDFFSCCNASSESE